MCCTKKGYNNNNRKDNVERKTKTKRARKSWNGTKTVQSSKKTYHVLKRLRCRRVEVTSN